MATHFIVGKKHKMSQEFSEKGEVFPVTIIKADPIKVIRVKDEKTDGYSAVQIGYGLKNEKNVKKSLKGQMKGFGSFEGLKEFRGGTVQKAGDSITAEIFKAGDKVTVSAISKGKGFQGVVKRHGFKGGPRSHGQKHSEREPGSIGGGLRNKVPKNMRMAGRMGSDRITVKNLTIVKVNPTQNEIMIKGAVPGRKGTVVEIRGTESN